ncbi:hypothetical protein NBRC110019_30540 [Neptunitalea chrysea]|uniref:Uncharacterized protein n=1 Tax=Neptunitalea chrysea TaxID=1647581 RepID=A0A9W6B9L1_9FLAO|nr:hypothetical protein [Neptunitalea chrysea]GLB54013.1 hypothetical protein NBRC110019_30540 [Neptunitalea chrysea]
MFSKSAIKGKINRSGINFKNTFLWENRPEEYIDDTALKLLLKDDETILICYIGKDNYRWILTDQRLFISSYFNNILLKDIIEIDFQDLKEKPENKMINNNLTILTKENKYTLYLEENTWTLFYDIFNFILKNQ